MTYEEIKKKTLSLIEEYNPDHADMTEDPDIATKFRDVTNMVMFELARQKKLPAYVEKEVTAGERITFKDIGKLCGREVYQLCTVHGVICDIKGNGTIIKAMESGTAEIDCFVYPERITEENEAVYEFELTPDVLEIMPYGIAADLLKSDVSAEYGSVYAQRYETMLNRLDPRSHMTSVYIEGGVSF